MLPTKSGINLVKHPFAFFVLSGRFASIAPIIVGWLADYFVDRKQSININWAGPQVEKVFHLLSLQGFNFLFLIGAAIARQSLEFLVHLHEVGEVDASLARRIIRKEFKNQSQGLLRH